MSEPEVVIHSLKPKDEILIMATDGIFILQFSFYQRYHKNPINFYQSIGVWEFISSEEAVQIVENTFMECDDENDEFMEDEEKASKASEALIQEATKRSNLKSYHFSVFHLFNLKNENPGIFII